MGQAGLESELRYGKQKLLFYLCCWLSVTDLFIALTGVDVKKNVVVTISSDKGLCGGINSTSVKVSRAIRKLNDGNYCYPGPAIL